MDRLEREMRGMRNHEEDDNDEDYYSTRDVNDNDHTASQSEHRTEDDESQDIRPRSSISKKEVRAVVKLALREAIISGKLGKAAENRLSKSQSEIRSSFEMKKAKVYHYGGLKFFFIVTIIYLAVMISIGLALLMHINAELPYIDLQLFSKMTETGLNADEKLGELPYNGTSVEAVAACSTSDNYDDLKMSIEKELKPLPVSVRKKLLPLIAVKEVSTMDSTMDTATGKGRNKATSFIAFWSTNYNGKFSPFAPKYTSCFMVASHTYSSEIDVIDWIVSNKKQVIGSRYCNCGLSACPKMCFSYAMMERQYPIFHPEELSVGQRIALHRLMAESAVKKVAQAQKQESLLRNALQDRLHPHIASLAWDIPQSHGVKTEGSNL